MLAAGLTECRGLGLDEVLLTCDPGNEPSRKVILANGGVPDGRKRGEDRFWIGLAATASPPTAPGPGAANGSRPGLPAQAP